MKITKIFLIGAMSICVLLSGCAAKTSIYGNQDDTANSNWKLVTTAENTNQAYYIGYFDENDGITVGQYGAIYYTENGGKLWQAAKNASNCLYGLDIVDKSMAFATGDDSTVMTTDAGKTWSALTFFGKGDPDHNQYVSFIDQNTGWVANTYMLGATVDGGKTWTAVTLPTGIGDIAAISRYDQNTGYLIDVNGIIYKTIDAGKTWTTKKLDISSLNLKQNLLSTLLAPHVTMKFYNDNEAVVAFSASTSSSYGTWVASTKDGGSTWTTEKLKLDDALKVTNVFLTNDGKYLTVTNSQDIQVFRYFK